MSFVLRRGLFGLSLICTISAIVLCAAVLLVGWGMSVHALLHPWPGSSAMIPHTALCIMMLGVALLATASPSGLVPHIVRPLCIGVMILVGMVMVLQVVTDLGLDRDSLLSFIDARHRMSVGTAIGLAALAGCIIRVSDETSRESDTTFALVACGNTTLSIILVVHSFDVNSSFVIPGFAAMSVFTASALMLMFTSLLLHLIARQENQFPDDWDLLSRG